MRASPEGSVLIWILKSRDHPSKNQNKDDRHADKDEKTSNYLRNARKYRRIEPQKYDHDHAYELPLTTLSLRNPRDMFIADCRLNQFLDRP